MVHYTLKDIYDHTLLFIICGVTYLILITAKCDEGFTRLHTVAVVQFVKVCWALGGAFFDELDLCTYYSYNTP